MKLVPRNRPCALEIHGSSIGKIQNSSQEYYQNVPGKFAVFSVSFSQKSERDIYE